MSDFISILKESSTISLVGPNCLIIRTYTSSKCMIDSYHLRLSLGNAIDLDLNFENFCNCLRFHSKIRDEFGSGFIIVATKSIKSCTDCIEKNGIYRNRLILYQNCSKLIKQFKIN